MKKKYLITVFAVLLAAITVLCGCSQSLDDRIGQVNDSIDSAKTSNLSIVIKDGETVVYEYTQTVTMIDKNQANVATTENKLAEDFTMQQTSAENVENRSRVAGVALASDNIAFSQLQKDRMVCIVESDKASSVLGADVQSKGDVNVTFVFNGKKLSEVTCEFTSSSNKNVTISYVYGY